MQARYDRLAMELGHDRRQVARDRRDAPRAQLVAAVRDAHSVRLFLSQDLSPGGMTVLRAKSVALPLWTPLRVEFELPGGRLVRADARVAHDRWGGRWHHTGLEFVNMDVAEADWVEGFVRSL